jgi:hypothetical protein
VLKSSRQRRLSPLATPMMAAERSLHSADDKWIASIVHRGAPLLAVLSLRVVTLGDVSAVAHR